MTTSYDVDVIIPCFNGALFVEKCINSVLSQTIDSIRIIFIDDGSQDESLEIASRMAKKHSNILIISQSNKGLSAARNVGIQNSTAPYLAFLDVDDSWRPTKLENQLKVLKDIHQAVASNYMCEVAGKLELGFAPSRAYPLSPRNLLMFKTVIPGSGSSVLLSKKVINSCGLFDETLHYAEDLDYWIRVAEQFEWVISEPRDVIIFQNPIGLQSTKNGPSSTYLIDSLILLKRYRKYISKVDFFFLSNYIAFAYKHSFNRIIRDPNLLFGLIYSVYLRLLKLLRRTGI